MTRRKITNTSDLVVIRHNFPPNGDRWYDSSPMTRRRARALLPKLRRNGLQFVVLRAKGNNVQHS